MTEQEKARRLRGATVACFPSIEGESFGVVLLEAMAAGTDPRLARDVALYQLGQVWDRQGKPDEANKVYRKLVDEFPESPYRNEVQQRLGSAS